jgi:prepilin-type processing-associated H-X9-DG protein
MLHESPSVAAGDYAACTGTTGFDFNIVLADGSVIAHNGAVRAVDGLRLLDITDGTTNTLLVGEKHVPLASLTLPPLDCGMYDGHNPACNTRAGGPAFPLAASDDDFSWKFGSRHPGICQFVFCDGSVRPLYVTIDPGVLGLLAQRNDNQPVPNY